MEDLCVPLDGILERGAPLPGQAVGVGDGQNKLGSGFSGASQTQSALFRQTIQLSQEDLVIVLPLIEETLAGYFRSAAGGQHR